MTTQTEEQYEKAGYTMAAETKPQTHAGGRPPKRKVIVETLEDSAYTVQEVADILKVHPHTVRSLIHSGELKAEKIGRGYRIMRSDLAERFTL